MPAQLAYLLASVLSLSLLAPPAGVPGMADADISSAVAPDALSSGFHENDDAALSFTGSWVVSKPTSGDSGNTSSTAEGAGDFVDVTFSGTGVRLFGRTNPWLGIGRVSLDGVLVGSTDQYASTQNFGQVIFERTDLADGVHTLRFERSGLKNASSTTKNVNLDRLQVLDSTAPRPIAAVDVAAMQDGVHLDWQPSESLDVSAYVIQRTRQSDGTDVAVARTAATTFVDASAEAGVGYTYAISVEDSSGNRSPQTVSSQVSGFADAAGVGVYEESSSAITLVGDWQRTSSAAADSAQMSAIAVSTDASASLLFEGSGVRILARTNPWLGIARVWLDDEIVATVDQYSVEQLSQQIMFDSGELTWGLHKLRIERVGDKNPASTTKNISLDAIRVLDHEAPPPVSASTTLIGGAVKVDWEASTAPDLDRYRVYRESQGATSTVAESTETEWTDTAVANGASWSYGVTAFDESGNESPLVLGPALQVTSQPARSGIHENGSSFMSTVGAWTTTKKTSGDSGQNSMDGTDSSSSVVMSFSGTGVQWIGRKNPWLGQADVFVDGVRVTRVDQYSPTQHFRQVLFDSRSLAPGVHEIRITRTGTKNASSTTKNINVDAIRVFDSTPPDAPLGVVSTPSALGATVSWDASLATDLDHYELFRGNEGTSALTHVASLSPSVRSLLDVGLTYGSTFRWTVVAVDTSGNRSKKSAWTALVSADPAPSVLRIADCPAATKTVSNAAQLKSALTQARSGDRIKLNDGIYAGTFSVSVRASADNPVWICGGRGAIVDNSNPGAGYGLHVYDSSNVIVSGFTIQNVKKGVSVSSSDHVTVSDMRVSDIGEEAIHLRYNTTDSQVVGNSVARTGIVNGTFGEGIYIGTDPKNWCVYTDCLPDRSDRNFVAENAVWSTSAEPIDVKAGSSNGIIRGNTVNSTNTAAGLAAVAVRGNEWLVEDNHVVSDGTALTAFDSVAGWGKNNVFARNTATTGSNGTAVLVKLTFGNVVACDNKNLSAGGIMTNDVCQR